MKRRGVTTQGVVGAATVLSVMSGCAASTTLDDLRNATMAIADFCGHPLVLNF